MHAVDDIEPGQSVNISVLSAFDCTQASPHNLRLKAEARMNMFAMWVTADTSHFDKSWLKVDAPENMDRMLVTPDTSHFDRSWLKVDAAENMYAITATADTSHFDRSWLKADAPENMSSMSVTADTSQSRIDPGGLGVNGY